MAVLDCLYTIVRNPTDSDMFYGWLPPHGRTIAAGETAMIPGELLPWLKGNMRKLRSIQQNLADGVIEVLQTPVQHAWCIDDAIKVVDIHIDDNGDYVPVAIDPCWQDSEDPSPSPEA